MLQCATISPQAGTNATIILAQNRYFIFNKKQFTNLTCGFTPSLVGTSSFHNIFTNFIGLTSFTILNSLQKPPQMYNQVFLLRFLEMEKSRHSLCGDREASIVVESCDFSFLSFDRIYILTTIHYSNGQRPTLCCSQIEMVPSKHVHQNKNQVWPKTKYFQSCPNSCRYAWLTPDQMENMFNLFWLWIIVQVIRCLPGASSLSTTITLISPHCSGIR